VLRASDGALLVSMWILLIVVLGVGESTAGPGINWSFIVPPAGNQTYQASYFTTEGSSMVSHTTIVRHTTPHTTTRIVSTTSKALPSSSTSTTTIVMASVGVSGLSTEMVAWYILIPIFLCLGGGMVALLIRRQKPDVFDLKGTIAEMESQRDYFIGTWSQKLRNAALLRYYVLMAQVCAKVGIEDRPTDTPNEFIGRASTELNVQGADSAKFADVVDRAHYGAELSGDEVAEASGFMDAFTRTVAGRAGLG